MLTSDSWTVEQHGLAGRPMGSKCSLLNRRQTVVPFYKAIAWVHVDSDIAQADLDNDPDTDPFALMAGKVSCHTSALGSSGMLLPMGFMISNGYVDVVGDPDTIDSLTDTVRSHFSEDSSIPSSGTPYHKYIGSLRCLAEHSTGDATDYISFAKDPTVPDYCGETPEDWCFEGDFDSTADFHGVNYSANGGDGFGRAPSHPVMFNPAYMDAANVAALQDALRTMSLGPNGRRQPIGPGRPRCCLQHARFHHHRHRVTPRDLWRIHRECARD